MAIRDVAGNPLPAGQQGQMIGFIEPPSPEEVLPLKAYHFLIEPIRTADTNDGALFVKRLFDGIQKVWEEQQATIFTMRDLWSVTKIADGFLPYLKNIVGWTTQLDHITKALDANTLRRLIAASVPLWKSRGPEDAMLNVLRLVTGTRMRMWNWFQFRWVADETELGEEHEGRDPWIINLPGPPDYDEYRSNLRIVDDGALNRNLVEDLVKLMRASGERIEISYIDFLDQFQSDGDNNQWVAFDGNRGLVEGNTLTLGDNTQEERITTSAAPSYDWANYVATWRLRSPGGAEFGVMAYVQDDNNYYTITLDTAANFVYLRKVVAGVPTLIASYDFSPDGVLAVDTWYAIRVQIGPDGANTRIKVYLDASELINTTDTAFTKGALGLIHATGATVELDEVEMFQLPLDTTLIDINP